MTLKDRGRSYLDTSIGITEVGLAMWEKDWAQLQIQKKKKRMNLQLRSKVEVSGWKITKQKP